MGSGMPEIGSRISLISRADIRYEGKLFSVDPEECTIALSSVRSYGTEDRESAFPVPAQNQVYDYILFRGTDIKDIRVLSTTIPNDPAIVQLSVPPSLNDSQFQSRTGYPQPPMAPMNMPNAPSTSRDQSMGGFPNTFAGVVNARKEMLSKSQSAQNVASEDGSRSSTPSNHHTKGSDTMNRVSIGSNADDQTQDGKKTSNGSYNNRDKSQGGNRYQQQIPRQQYQPRYQQQPRYQNHQSQQHQQQPRYSQQQQQSYYRDYNNRDNHQYRNYNDYRDSYGGQRQQYMQPMRNQQRSDGWNSYDLRNNRNRMGQNMQQRVNYQSTGYQNQNRRPKNTLKFDDDYDFEQANSEFEQMRSQLEKTKLIDGPEEPLVKMNGDVDSKKEDSGNEAISGGEENDIENEDKPIFYDKVKSFFDQISYEAIERSKGLTARMDWKTERKINSETFGALALRRPNYHGGRVGQNGGNYYNNQNRNTSMANNNYRGRYNRPQQQYHQPQPNHQRRSYNNATNKNHEMVETRST